MMSAQEDIRFQWIAVFLNFDKNSQFRVELPATGKRLLFTCVVYEAQTSFYNLEHRPNNSFGFLVVANKSDAKMMSVSSGSHHFVQYNEKNEGGLQRTPNHHNLLYHVYFDSDDNTLPDVIKLGSCDCLFNIIWLKNNYRIRSFAISTKPLNVSQY